MSLNRSYIVKSLYVGIGAFFSLYVLARSILVGVTYDEAFTIKLSNGYPFVESILRLLLTANNHIINTFGIKVIYLSGFDSLFLFRLPNVISFFFYQYFCYRIVAKNLSGYTGVVCFFLLSCNLFLLDFFGLARGYGMSIAFMMGALCLGLETLRSFSVGKSIKSLVLGGFSVLSIYSMIYFWCALFLALHLIPLTRRDFGGFKQLLFRSLAFAGGLFFIVAPTVALLMWRKQLYYGGHVGFYEDTILSLTKYSFYNPELVPAHYIASGVFVFIFVVVSVWSFICKFETLSPKVFILFIALSIGIGVVVSHKVFGILYLLDRSALFLYPIAILALFLNMEPLGKGFKSCVSVILLCVSSFVFILNANFYKAIRWEFDSRTEEILSAINQQGKVMGRVVNLGFQSPLGVSMEYYLQGGRYPYIHVLHSGGYTVPDGVDYYVHISRRRDLGLSQQGNIYEIKESLGHYSKNVFLDYPDDNIIVYCELKAR